MDGSTFLVFALFGGLFFGGLSALLGSARGVNGWGCFFMGLFFGPIGLLYAALAPGAYAPPIAEVAADQAEEPVSNPLKEPIFGRSDVPEALTKLADLRDRGALTEDEFSSAKAALLKQL